MSTKPKVYEATLVRGELYIFNGQNFRKGKPLQVDEKTMKHLKQHAVWKETLGKGEENITLPQFTFKEVKGETAAPAKLPPMDYDPGDDGYTDDGEGAEADAGEPAPEPEDAEGEDEGDAGDADDAPAPEPAPTRRRKR